MFLLCLTDGRTRVRRKPHEYMHPSCLMSTLQVVVWGDGEGCVFMAHIWPLDESGSMLECHRISRTSLSIRCNSSWQEGIHLRIDFFGRIMPHVTKLGLSRNVTVNSAYCSVLPSHLISIQLDICGMRWNELFGVQLHYQPT